MGDKTGIEWTDATWNPIRGCSRVSEGCRNCYAETVANRFKGDGQPYEGLIAKGGQWNGTIKFVPEMLDQPLRWRRPRRIFVNSMSDLFHENVPDEVIDEVFGVMSMARQHTFQVLTKRPERMRDYLLRWKPSPPTDGYITRDGVPHGDNGKAPVFHLNRWPLPNVWLGVSVEDQKAADERIPVLLQTPAAVRWISAEPLLGPVNPFKSCCDWHGKTTAAERAHIPLGRRLLDWVVVGGESGPHARPMHPAWARSLRDQCSAAGVPFLFKQWGEWSPEDPGEIGPYRDTAGVLPDGSNLKYSEGYVAPFDTMDRLRAAGSVRLDGRFLMHSVGKKRAGRLLDGKLHDGYPGQPPQAGGERET